MSEPDDACGYEPSECGGPCECDEHQCRCNGSGFIVICPDDICRGVGECMHGDGQVVCPCQE